MDNQGTVVFNQFSTRKLNTVCLRKPFSEPWTGYISDDMWIKWKTWLNGPCDEYFCDFYEIFWDFLRFFVNKLIWTEWWELESVAATDMHTWVSQLWCHRYALCHHYVTGLSHASSIGWHDSFPFISFREFLRIWIIQLYSGEHIHPVLKLRLL